MPIQSFKSKKPYFNQSSADKVRPLLDKLSLTVDTGKVYQILFKNYIAYRPNTLRQLVFQGWEYLAEKGDYKYKTLRNHYTIEMSPTALRFVYRGPTKSNIEATPTLVESDNTWRNKLGEFLDTSESGSELVVEVNVAPSVRQDVEMMLAGVKDMFEVVFTADKLTIRRL